MQAGRPERYLLLRVITCLAIALASFARSHFDARNTGAVGAEMRNVMYHFSDQIATHIWRLEGQLVPTRQDGIPFFDDNRSFILAIASAEISITTDAMANVL